MSDSELKRLRDENETLKDDHETLKSRIQELEEKVILSAAKYDLTGVTWEQAKNYNELKAGDHVAFWEYNYWHHAIVEEVPGNQVIKLILWSLSPREIIRRVIKLEIGSGTRLERAVYNKGCYEPELVVERAQARVGETEYGFFTNFARAFPEWCKTGKGRLTHSDKEADNRYKRYVMEQRKKADTDATNELNEPK